MTFPLTKSGRENLEAILAEFERAGRYYPPLYHERLIHFVPWSSSGEEGNLSDAQWQAFIDAESDNLDDGEWSEWDGPHSASPGFSGSCLDRWYGNPDGQEEFISLAESVTDVLKREDFSSVDYRKLEFAFRSWNQWISTIHAWAFRFQMPLLRCEMDLWGAEDADQDDFYELSKLFNQTDGVFWPLHPVRWSLTYNLFTSSAAAIRLILRPKTGIGCNEPWPFSNEQTADKPETPQPPEDEGSIVPTSCHRLVFGSTGWCLQLADSDRPFGTKYQTGLQRIAALVECSGEPIELKTLYGYGGRAFRNVRTAHKRQNLETGDHLTISKSLINSYMDPDTEEGRQKIGEQLQQLLEDKEKAIQQGNATWLNETQAEIDDINKHCRSTKDGEVLRQRKPRDKERKWDRDAVIKTIEDAILDLKRQIRALKPQVPEHVTALEELKAQISFDPEFKFEPKPGHTPWQVVRQA